MDRQKRKEELKEILADLVVTTSCHSCGWTLEIKDQLWGAIVCPDCGGLIKNTHPRYVEYDSLFSLESNIEYTQLKLRDEGHIFPDGFFDDERFDEMKALFNSRNKAEKNPNSALTDVLEDIQEARGRNA